MAFGQNMYELCAVYTLAVCCSSGFHNLHAAVGSSYPLNTSPVKRTLLWFTHIHFNLPYHTDLLLWRWTCRCSVIDNIWSGKGSDKEQWLHSVKHSTPQNIRAIRTSHCYHARWCLYERVWAILGPGQGQTCFRARKFTGNFQLPSVLHKPETPYSL